MSIVTFACALLSKATAVTLPALLLILNVYPMRRVGGAAGWWSVTARRAYVELLPFAIASLAVGVLSIVALQPGPQLAWSDKLAMSAYALAFYLWKSIAPFNLAPLYERPSRLPTLSPTFIASYATVLGGIGVVWLVRRRWPAVSAALVGFAVAVFPLLGLIQNGPQLAADRYTYHAAPALALLFGAAFVAWRRLSARVGGLVVLGCLAVLTFRQTRVWRSSEVLWSRVLELDSASYLANNNFGVVLAEQGRSTEAIAHYRRALRTRPSYADAYNNLGYELAQVGDLAGAVEAYQAALSIDPAFADAQVNWGNVLYAQSRFADAVAHYAVAATLDPERAGVHFNWGLALTKQGDLHGAIAHYQRALELDPDLPDARSALADALDRVKPIR